MNEVRHSRRAVLRVLGGACGAVAFWSATGCGGGGRADCNDLSGVDTRTRVALHYVPRASDPSRRCSLCTLYTPPATAGACGTCQAFPGPVEADGTCDSFVARS